MARIREQHPHSDRLSFVEMRKDEKSVSIVIVITAGDYLMPPTRLITIEEGATVPVASKSI